MEQKQEVKINYEKIKLFEVYKHEGKIGANLTDDADRFEVFGFLKILLKDFEKKLLKDMQDDDD